MSTLIILEKVYLGKAPLSCGKKVQQKSSSQQSNVLAIAAENISDIFDREKPFQTVKNIVKIITTDLQTLRARLKFTEDCVFQVSQRLLDDNEYDSSLLALFAAVECAPKRVGWAKKCFIQYAKLYKKASEHMTDWPWYTTLLLSQVFEYFFDRLLINMNTERHHNEQFLDFHYCVKQFGKPGRLNSDLLVTAKGNVSWINYLAQALINDNIKKYRRAKFCYDKVIEFIERSPAGIRKRILGKHVFELRETVVLKCIVLSVSSPRVNTYDNA